MSFKIERVDFYSEQNECHLQHCLTTHSNEQCRNQLCNFSLPVVNLSKGKPLLLQWVPINEQAGDLIILNYKVSITSH